MTIDYIGPDASPQALCPAGDCGNLNVTYGGAYEAAALAQNKVVALGKVPMGSEIIGLSWAHDALGATNGLTFGWETEDGVTASAAAFYTDADVSTAAKGYAAVMPFVTTKDIYLTVTKTGAGTATGTIVAKAHYIYRGQ